MVFNLIYSTARIFIFSFTQYDTNFIQILKFDM